ncbi:hypothetical protein APP_24100 [Aeribacillus pallidus]|jgi:hypothetical protein|nr:hypothetical protein APP_24100 [Aeribacillus pallidus]
MDGNNFRFAKSPVAPNIMMIAFGNWIVFTERTSLYRFAINFAKNMYPFKYLILKVNVL